MKALVHVETGRVCQVEADDATFEVHPDFEWRTCPNDIKGGFAKYDSAKNSYEKHVTLIPTKAQMDALTLQQIAVK